MKKNIQHHMGKDDTVMKPWKTILYVATLMMFLGTPPHASAQTLSDAALPPGTEELLKEIQRTMYPPWLYRVTLKPDPPIAGEPITVTAEIYNDPDKTDDDTIEAYLFYSMDQGETWETLEMDDNKTNREWTVEMPAFEQGDEVWYGFRAGDATGNVFTETPCYITTWPPLDDTCMFDFAVDEPPVDDPNRLIPDNFDFLTIRGGVDEDNLYLELNVQGSIEPGSVSPVFLHLFGFAVANLDQGDPADVVSQGFLAIHAPLAHIAALDPCMTISRPNTDVVFSAEFVQCQSDEDHLWFKISNKQLGNTEPQGHLKIIAADGAVTSLVPFTGIFYDYTHVTSLSLAGRSFVVQ